MKNLPFIVPALFLATYCWHFLAQPPRGVGPVDPQMISAPTPDTPPTPLTVQASPDVARDELVRSNEEPPSPASARSKTEPDVDERVDLVGLAYGMEASEITLPSKTAVTDDMRLASPEVRNDVGTSFRQVRGTGIQRSGVRAPGDGVLKAIQFSLEVDSGSIEDLVHQVGGAFVTDSGYRDSNGSAIASIDRYRVGGVLIVFFSTEGSSQVLLPRSVIDLIWQRVAEINDGPSYPRSILARLRPTGELLEVRLG